MILKNKKIIIFVFSVILCATAFFAFNELAFAQQNVDFGLQPVEEGTGLPSTDIRIIAARIIRVFLGLLGIIALGLFLYAGYLWMTAGGNEEQIGTAKKFMLNSVIGLAIILSSYAIVTFVMNSLLEATTGFPSHCSNKIQDEDERGIDCGGSCRACSEDGNGNITNPYTPIKQFYIVKSPAGGTLCIRNVYPAIVFNRQPDIATISGNILVRKDASQLPVVGEWKLNDNDKNSAYFKPQGACPSPDTSNDCLDANTKYVLEIKNPNSVKTGDGSNLTLSCSLGAKCGNVDFTTGDGVDRKQPTIKIDSPTDGLEISSGGTRTVLMSFSDDNGVQNISLKVDGDLIGSESLAGCKKSGQVKIEWNLFGFVVGWHTLEGFAVDWTSQTAKNSVKVKIKPGYCYNGVKDFDETFIDCGGSCGACQGDKCVSDSNCASGYCFKPSGATEGKCVDKMSITNITSSGGIGEYVTVSGKYFGTNKGKVYFAKKDNPNIDVSNDWVEAQIANCGSGFNNWTNNQIVVVVPQQIVSGPIKVETATFKGIDGKDTKFIDLTNDSWGPKLVNFQLTTDVKPSLCSASPNIAAPGKTIQIYGKNFGAQYDPVNDWVEFGGTKAKIVSWFDNEIRVTVPPTLSNGQFSLNIANDKKLSNGILFAVEGAVVEGPVIYNLSQINLVKGDYLTITGKNFGNNSGNVWFKLNGTGGATSGDFSFPSVCKIGLWSDAQVIVKIPKTIDINKKYSVQIVRGSDRIVSQPANEYLNISEGKPAPGICGIDPISGPVPFVGNDVVKVYGEYFGTVDKVYFWKTNANESDFSSWAQVKIVAKPSENILHVQPGADVKTGPFKLFDTTSTKASNKMMFSAFDCTQNKNTCNADGFKCCASGDDAGVCKPAGDLCLGEKRVGGYVWRFSTKDIPKSPQVVERCDSDTALGKNLPTPSPSTQWNDIVNSDANNVCLNANAIVEFNMMMDQTSINASNVVVNKCSEIDGGKCKDPATIVLSPSSFKLNTVSKDLNNLSQFIEINPASKWEQNTLYQVVLKAGVKSHGATAGSSMVLSPTKPCGKDTAYCFSFKTGAANCKLSKMIITPTSYWTNLLEAPIKYHSMNSEEYPIEYKGNGLTDQKCIMMSMNDFNWSWSSSNKNFADIYPTGANTAMKAQAAAFRNTTGMTDTGLENGAVKIQASASNGVNNYSNFSPLTIDLTVPKVIDYWPNCFESCLNAEVGVKFNINMSIKNLSSNSVRVSICNDENCLSKKSIFGYALSLENKNTILKISNLNLVKDTLCLVELSSADNSSKQLWSMLKISQDKFAQDLLDPNNYSKVLPEFSWKFRTKSKECSIESVKVVPVEYVASNNIDKTIFYAEAFGAPDKCSAKGQKINAWDYDWVWANSDNNVAQMYTFSTKGQSKYCTKNCVLKGSDLPVGVVYPICGNGKVEAGEDCDIAVQGETPSSCNLQCLRSGNKDTKTCGNGKVEWAIGEACDTQDSETKINCSSDCRKTGSDKTPSATDVNKSICGNGLIGSGEDCDLGIASDFSKSQSSALCSEKCLHLGSAISSSWCFKNKNTFGGYVKTDFNLTCGSAYSQCGDGQLSPDEEVGCDGNIQWDGLKCSVYCLRLKSEECVVGEEGCSEDKNHLGSSLLYSTPSVCGDKIPGIGEDSVCESAEYLTTVHDKLNPWVLVAAKGVAQTVSGPKAFQETKITASSKINDKTKSAVGKFIINCGYQSDKECQINGAGYGVGADSCCYKKVNVGPVYPSNNSQNVCLNAQISADFSGIVDEKTIGGNFVIARGTAEKTCPAGTENVSGLVILTKNNFENLTWYQKVFASALNVFNKVFANEVSAGNVANWCAGKDTATFKITKNNNNTSALSIILDKPLATGMDYAVILKPEIKDVNGVALSSNVKNGGFYWQFITAQNLCEVNSVSIDPSSFYFKAPNQSASFVAKTHSTNGQLIQPIANIYEWKYIWGPENNQIATIQNTESNENTITSQNRNGEIDIYASANVNVNSGISNVKTGVVATGKAHIIVFLCENPWPPTDLNLNNTGPYKIFPYEDAVKNNDNFDLVNNTFDNTAIPGSGDSGAGYFNFSTYYCADNGDYGVFDDLPYMRPSVQTKNIAVSIGDGAQQQKIAGTCEMTGKACFEDGDCGKKRTINTQVFADYNKFGLCIGKGKQNNNSNYFFDNKGFAQLCDSDNICNGAEYNVWIAKNNFYPECVSFNNYSGPIQLKCNPAAGKQTLPQTPSNVKILKRFILTNTNNSDAIGIQIFSNPKHLTPLEWYTSSKDSGGQNFSSGDIKELAGGIDGYSAITDGNNIYVNAINFANSSEPNKGDLFTNIYLFSINANAKPETRKVFEQLMKNIKFNTNLTNYHLCEKTMSGVGSPAVCETDFDCAIGDKCSAQVDKLKRNLRRLYDLSDIEDAMESFFLTNNNKKYPSLTEGSYITGQTISTWPSWNKLSSDVGSNLPIDPVNKLGKAGTCAVSNHIFCLSDQDCVSAIDEKTKKPETCLFHDPTTGWSTADKRYSFACSPDSLAYRYFAPKTANGTDYKIYYRFEDSGLDINNANQLIVDMISNVNHFWFFMSPSINNTGSLCIGGTKEISTMQTGICGDGQINTTLGEECDPPGKKEYSTSDCDKDTSAGAKMGVKVCSSACKWIAAPQELCAKMSVCGNSKVEPGEKCDDGVLNGKYNHCSKDCQSEHADEWCGNSVVSSTYEVCDIKPGGWCVGGIRNDICNTDRECNGVCVSEGKEEKANMKPDGISYFCSNTNMELRVSSSGECKTADNSGVRYGADQKSSCGFDCQTYGPYCGDSKVQTEFGEECDGAVDCGGGGKYECDMKTCNFKNNTAQVWYRFSDSYIKNNSSRIFQNSASTTQALFAYCNGSDCPTIDSGDKYGKAVYFSGKQFLSVGKNPALITNELTLAMWIKTPPNMDITGTRGILSKTDNKDTDYSLDVLIENNKLVGVKFLSPTILGNSEIKDKFAYNPNEWHFIVITVDADRKHTYYSDGNEVYSAQSSVFNKSRKAEGDFGLKIGSSTGLNKWVGGIDEFQLYNKVLSSEDVKRLFEKTNAFCTAQTIKSSPSAAVGCGNEVIDENEACDKGANNGIVCVPGYNKPCTYCSADCKNTITVNPKEYCGNGIIESNEKCDVDEKGNIYYFTTTTGTNIESLGTSSEPDNKNSGYKVSSCAEEYNTKLNKGSIIEFNKKSWVSLTLSKKGEKSCINNCSLLQNKCVECGLDEKAGAGVTINLINVVSSDNPLQIGDDKNGKTLEGNVGLFFVSPQLDLDIDPTYLFKNKHRVAFSYSSDKTSKQRVLHPANYTDSSDTSVAKINSDPICSAFSSDADYRYRLAINADTKQNHMLDFPISATPATGQYDLVLSPVFKDSKQIRIVISWVGNADFDGGFLVNDNGTVKYIEGATGGVAKSESYDYAVKPPSYGFWYHKLKDPGLKDPGFATKAESFTLDVSKMTVSSTQYAFYVKSEGNTAINKFKNTAKLKVEVYFADTDIDVRHFSRPTATYYLSNAIPSDNPAAFYWHVFNVPKSTGNTPVSIDNLTQINLMRTDILFDYSTIYQKP